MSAILEVLRLPDVRRIELGWFASMVGELTGTVAMLIFAHNQGGAAMVAFYGVARTVPAMLVSPVLVSAGDRISQDRILRLAVAARVALMALAALGAAYDAPAIGVVVVAAGASWLAGVYRPIQAAVLPWLARTPGELTAANVVSSLMENAGVLVGPLVAGIALATVGAAAAMGLAAVALVGALVAILWLEVPRDHGHEAHRVRTTNPLANVAAGAAAIARIAPPGGIPLLVFAQCFVRGVLTVLLVVLALDVLDLGEASVGWLSAATGVGGLVGGIAAGALMRVTTLGRGFVLGLLLWGLPLVALAIAPSPLVAYLALSVVGIGNAIEDVGLFTLVPRVLGPRIVGRALGAVELAVFIGLAAGSLAAPPLAATVGALNGLGIVGLGLAALATVYTIRFWQLDRALPRPGPELELLRANPIFAPLPLATVELLATELEPHEHAVGTVIIREGAAGDRLYLIEHGSATVSAADKAMSTLGRGDCFGEIALLRDVPRTATVTAATPMRTYSLARDEFLAAVAGSRSASESAHAMVDERMAAGSASGR